VQRDGAVWAKDAGFAEDASTADLLRAASEHVLAGLGVLRGQGDEDLNTIPPGLVRGLASEVLTDQPASLRTWIEATVEQWLVDFSLLLENTDGSFRMHHRFWRACAQRLPQESTAHVAEHVAHHLSVVARGLRENPAQSQQLAASNLVKAAEHALSQVIVFLKASTREVSRFILTFFLSCFSFFLLFCAVFFHHSQVPLRLRGSEKRVQASS